MKSGGRLWDRVVTLFEPEACADEIRQQYDGLGQFLLLLTQTLSCSAGRIRAQKQICLGELNFILSRSHTRT
jgi:hypothetical protein